MRYIFVTTILSLCINLFTSNVSAQIYHYEDSEGRKHYVDSESKIPDKYKENVKKGSDFPSISKVSGPEKSNIDLSDSLPESPSEKIKAKDNRTEKSDPENHSSIKNNDYKLELFVANWCSHCRSLEANLKNSGIDYKRYDIENSETGKKIYEELGRGGIPISRINGSKIIRGNEPNKIIDALKKS